MDTSKLYWCDECGRIKPWKHSKDQTLRACVLYSIDRVVHRFESCTTDRVHAWVERMLACPPHLRAVLTRLNEAEQKRERSGLYDLDKKLERRIKS